MNDFKAGGKMIDIEKLLKAKHIKICGNKYFSWSCLVENGISELELIRIFGKRFLLPHKLRKWTRHKERF